MSRRLSHSLVNLWVFILGDADLDAFYFLPVSVFSYGILLFLTYETFRFERRVQVINWGRRVNLLGDWIVVSWALIGGLHVYFVVIWLLLKKTMNAIQRADLNTRLNDER